MTDAKDFEQEDIRPGQFAESKATLSIDADGADAEVEMDDVEGADEPTKIPDKLPVLPVRDNVSFPGTVMPINVGRQKSKRVLDLALASDRMIGVFAQRSSETEDPTLDDLYRIGTACRILKMFKLPDGTETIIVHGVARVGIEAITQETPYVEARVNHHVDKEEASTEIDALVHNVRHSAERIMELSPHVPEEARIVLENITSPGGMADFLAANLSLSLVHKQELLETFGVSERLRKVYLTLSGQLEVLELSNKLKEQVGAQMDKSQREYYLREQLKAIQSELGQSDARGNELDALKKKVEDAKLPEAAAKAANRELERLAIIPQASPEYSVALDYVEWLASLPWEISTEDQFDLDRAEKVLNADHHGLQKIKRRILEFLAVRKLNPEGRGSILCFAGPPGVGKTSLGRSIARALGRNFIRMSLGGVRDESEIRGHRRTYVGAMPGRIIQEIKKCGSNNPVFMLDEIDKIGNDFRGDPASALLEVLDPQQNDTFTDHYLDVAFDLSDVFFIATANYMEDVPHALYDRMEVITLSSYTRREKLEIARNYLVPRQLLDNGLSADKISFKDEALEEIIGGHTRESGVRELERRIGAVCRAIAAKTVRGDIDRHQVTAKTVEKELGPARFESDMASNEGLPGVATALAFTSVGGEILFIEATRMPGRGSMTLTGQIGDVMRESAQAAHTLIRARARNLRVSLRDIFETDLHVHLPAGAVPKDGPSAGTAMLVAMISCIKKKPIDPRVAFTGEITLRGAVLPVGGIKEKFLGAHRAGIRKIIMPKGNMKDLSELPDDVRKDLTFVPVTHIDEVIAEAFKKVKAKRKVGKVKRTVAKKKSVKRPTKKKSATRKSPTAEKTQKNRKVKKSKTVSNKKGTAKSKVKTKKKSRRKSRRRAAE
jgi:ATP-dependent Lon protease